MKNIHEALVKHNLHSDIKVSSPIALSALGSSYPSSAGSFRPELVEPVFKPMLEFLRGTGSYLMVNVYPFFAYESNADVISLDYALFRQNPGVVDPGNGLRYYNLFDAQIDAVFAAMSALKYDDVNIVVTETGWPSKGDNNEVGASVDNAAAYNGNLIRKILTRSGTPLRPKADLTVYLFALFNENQKPGPTSERNFGLFNPDETRVYNVPFTVGELKDYHDRPSPANGVPSPAPVVSGGVSKSTTGNTWCVANPDADKVKLQAALDFACGEGGADCRPIQHGATCYDPNTLVAHASFAFNSYYQKQSRKGGSCYFGGTSYVVTQEPIKTAKKVQWDGKHSNLPNGSIKEKEKGNLQQIRQPPPMPHTPMKPTSSDSLLKSESIFFTLEPIQISPSLKDGILGHSSVLCSITVDKKSIIT
ncbi:hypothetical protein Fmac_030892 [Flemingia macrophylla]|uniref:glucan endo-1,3-beta-D-glucosidase n=1 Tax=Flemingia macrophylla TaxID=520843 RepID=A0ABD1L0H9_9FABA